MKMILLFNKKLVVSLVFLITLFTVIVYSNPGAPSISNLILNSSEHLNTSQENLTISFTTTDPDGDNVKNITVWYLNNQSLPVLYFPFENNSNLSNTQDYSSYHNDGNLTSANCQYLSTGGYDGFGAYNFSGDLDQTCITIPRTNFNITQNLTVIFRFKANNVDSNHQYIISRSSIGTSNHFYFDLTSNSGIIFNVFNSTSSKTTTYADTSITTPEIWHFVAGTFSESGTSTNNVIKLYVDGALRDTDYINGTIGTKSTLALQVGCMNSAKTYYYFNGTIDEVMIFNRSLSAEEINFLWENKTNILSSNEIRKGDMWQANITPVDINQERGTSINSSYIQILNGEPVTTNSFSPSDPTDLNDINISIQYFDKEGDLMNATFSIYKNNIFINQTNFTNLAGNVLVSQFINSSEYIGQDNLIVSAYAFDGEFNSSITNSSIIPIYPIVNGATYKPSYGNEEVELAVLTMNKQNSIENNRRWIGSSSFNVSYRVRDPNNAVYQNWKNISIFDNSFGNTTFNLANGILGTYFIDLKPDYANVPTEIINFTFSGYTALPFYRENIIKAADFVISNQSVDGLISGSTVLGVGPIILTQAYSITGNYSYYNGSVININIMDNTDTFIYSTCGVAQFQLYSNDTQFQNNISRLAYYNFVGPLSSFNCNTTNVGTSCAPYQMGEGMYCFNKAYEATNNLTIKLFSNNVLMSLIDPAYNVGNYQLWNSTKGTWNQINEVGGYDDQIFTGTLPIYGLYGNNSNATYIYLAKEALDHFVPNFYQNTSYGHNLTTLYSQEIYGTEESGIYNHFAAEPIIAMVGVYNATGDREWLLKASVGAKYLSCSQQENGRYIDDGISGGEAVNVWNTMWPIWALEKFPQEVSINVVDYRYNLTINDARWYKSQDKLWANVSIPSGQLGYIKFTVQNLTNKFAYIDGVQTSNYAIDGNIIYVWSTGSNHVMEVGSATYPFFYNITFWDNVTSTYNELGKTFNGSFTIGDLDTNDNFNISTFWYEGNTIIISNNTDGSNMSNYTNSQINGSMRYISQNLTSNNYRFGYNYSLGIYACDSNGNCNESNSTTLFISTAPPGSGGGPSGPDEANPPEEEPVVQEPVVLPEEELKDIINEIIDIIPDPIASIDALTTDNSIIVNLLTESGIQTKLKLILDDVGLLKKKPRLSIEFKMPEIKGEVNKFKLFDFSNLITLFALLMFILFAYSNYKYIKSG